VMYPKWRSAIRGFSRLKKSSFLIYFWLPAPFRTESGDTYIFETRRLKNFK
jgi:hypothetical protein